MASTRQLLESPPAQGPSHPGFDYDDMGPLSFTITVCRALWKTLAALGPKYTHAGS